MASHVAVAGGNGRSASFHERFTAGHVKRPAMNSLMSRFMRLLMLALVLATTAWQPALAQDDDDSGPSSLRDTETEMLFNDIARQISG